MLTTMLEATTQNYCSSQQVARPSLQVETQYITLGSNTIAASGALQYVCSGYAGIQVLTDFCPRILRDLSHRKGSTDSSYKEFAILGRELQWATLPTS